MVNSSSASKRPRGAPPGNQNARKLGFYSAQNPVIHPIGRKSTIINLALDPRDELARDIQQALKEVYAKIDAGELVQD